MKKITLRMLAAILLCGATVSASAQESKHEIGVAYGAGPTSNFSNFFAEVIPIVLTGGKISYTNQKEFGPLSADYFYHVTPMIGVGGIFTYNHQSKDYLVGGEKEGAININYFTLLPAAKFDWLHKDYFGLYSKLGVGAALRMDKQTYEAEDEPDEKNSRCFFNLQASFIGIEGGSRHIHAFAELGLGEQGIILAGLRYKL